MLIGVLGIVLILIGYYVFFELFGGKFKIINELFVVMSFILGIVIIGMFFFYKGLVMFILNIIWKSKGGYLNILEVLLLLLIMFRMKLNVLLLMIIIIVLVFVIGLLLFVYILYYLVEKIVE